MEQKDKNNEIKKNMYRDRAEKLPDITDEMWNQVNKEYRDLVKEYISTQSHSPQTKKQYTSMLRQFGWYICDSLNNKPFYKIKKRDVIRFLTYLRDDRKMSPGSIGTRKAAISSLCNFVENVIVDSYDDDEDNPYENFRNFTRGLPPIPKSPVYEKVKITREEYLEMMQALKDDENYLGMAWLGVAFNTGARRNEILQFKAEIVNYPTTDDMTYVMSHNVRLKGPGEDGKVEPYMINFEAIQYMKLYLEKRGYEHEYIFTKKYGGKIKVVEEGWANYFCKSVLSHIVGRRINPHLFKASAVTYLLEQGVTLELVSKYVAHHNDISTTIKHYDLRDHAEEKNRIFGNFDT